MRQRLQVQQSKQLGDLNTPLGAVRSPISERNSPCPRDVMADAQGLETAGRQFHRTKAECDGGGQLGGGPGNVHPSCHFEG